MKLISSNSLRNSLLNYLTLFSSMSTLICCALPTLLVSLGLGAVIVGLTSTFPALIWVSENKIVLFLTSLLFIIGNGLLLIKNKNAPCPVDLKLREACLKGRRASAIIYFVSVSLFSIGFFFAFIVSKI